MSESSKISRQSAGLAQQRFDCNSDCSPLHPAEGQAQAPERDVGLKKETIARACQSNDVEDIIRLATSEGGLLNDDLRCQACKQSLTCNPGD
jgi:hypothetical protein